MLECTFCGVFESVFVLYPEINKDYAVGVEQLCHNILLCVYGDGFHYTGELNDVCILFVL